jgi:Tol biopolymer transport system component
MPGISFTFAWFAASLSANPASDLLAASLAPGHASPFAPGLVTQKGKGAARCVFVPDGSEMTYARFTEDKAMNIVIRRFENGAWSEEEIAPFSGTGCDFEPCYVQDGNRIYFTSKRENGIFNLYCCDRKGTGWGEPRRLSGAIDSPAWELFSLPTAGGDFYFVSNREGGLGDTDIYQAQGFDGTGAANVVNLGEPVNSTGTEFDPCPSADGKCLIFSRNGDLYATRKDENGGWTTPVSLGAAVNHPDTYEVAPVLSPDGRVLLFTSFGKDTIPDIFAIGTDDIPVLAGK